MKKTITKMTEEHEKELKNDFLVNLGSRLRAKREKAGLSQKELGFCIAENNSAISRYENGTRSISVSQLPLISVYCDFPVHELFPTDESKAILDAFSSAISIVASRAAKPYKKENEKSLKDKYKDAEISTECEPYTDMEFCEYMRQYNKEKLNSIISAGNFLSEIKDEPQTDNLRQAVADYIVDGLVIEMVSSQKASIEQNKRVYAYYHYMMNHIYQNKKS